MGIRAQGNPIASFADLWSQTGTDASGATPDTSPGSSTDPKGHTATGGVISDYSTPSGKVYRTHVFTSSGTFEVTVAAPTLEGASPTALDVFAVAGGGGGSGSSAGTVINYSNGTASPFILSLARVTQSIDLDDTVSAEDCSSSFSSVCSNSICLYLAAISSALLNTFCGSLNMSPGSGSSALVDKDILPLSASKSIIITFIWSLTFNTE